MRRDSVIRGLRIAWSVAFGLISLSVALLWFRSSRCVDVIDRRGASGELAFVLSANGTMTFSGCPNLWAFVRVSNWSNLEDIFTIECDSPPLSDSGGDRIMVPEGVPKDGVDRAGRRAEI
jgi:hypothetical protein